MEEGRVLLVAERVVLCREIERVEKGYCCLLGCGKRKGGE